jgi:integrase/recombinase XerC
MGTEVIPFTPAAPVLFAAPRRILIEAFLKGRNLRTLEAYRADVADFCRFIGVDSEDIDGAARVLLERSHGEANGLALAYRAQLVDKGLRPATVNRRLAAMKSLVKLARTLGLVPWTLECPGLRSEGYRDTSGPGREGFRAMLDAAKHHRDRAILRLLHDLGLRRAEVIGMDLEDVDLEAETVWILGKGRTQKERLTLPEPTKAALAAWIRERGPAPGPLFTNRDRAGKGTANGRRLTGTGLYLMVRGLGARAGLKTRPHALRHCGITTALDVTNGNVRAVQKFSRHRDIATVMIYDDNRRDLAGDVAKLVAEAL